MGRNYQKNKQGNYNTPNGKYQGERINNQFPSQ